MGSFTSLFMQALFNVSVVVSNVVVKYTAPNTVTTATCGAIKCFTAADAWRVGLKVSLYLSDSSSFCCATLLILHIVKQSYSLIYDCFSHQEDGPYIRLLLLSDTTAVRMQ